MRKRQHVNKLTTKCVKQISRSKFNDKKNRLI